jgi:hypothetical protein
MIDGKTKYCELHGNKDSQNLICPEFLHECNKNFFSVKKDNTVI